MGRQRAALAVLGVAILGIACSDVDTTDDRSAEMPVPAPSTTEVPAAVTVEDDVSVITATLGEWSVTLSRDSVPAGVISFDVRNAGTMVHRLEVEGNGQEWETGDLPPGDAVTMSVSLAPGIYEVYCPLETADVDHEERGMKTVLRVH